MRATLAALALSLLLPSAALAQYDDQEGEGTYSTYSAEEARVELPEGYQEVEVQYGQARHVSAEQELFDTFWYELSKYGRWEEDPTYSWVWYPNVADFRPYSDGWWVYTNEGWTFESDAPYGWAVYHYGRWAYLSGGWAWLPGYEWSPGWVTLRVSGSYIGWSPIGPAGYVWDYWPSGWGYGYSPWLFVSVGDFGRRHHRHHYCDRDRGSSAFHEAAPVPAGHGSGRGGAPNWREIPNTHHAEAIPIVEGSKPVDPGASSTGSVVIYRPRPTLTAPTYGSGGGSGGAGKGYLPTRPQRPTTTTVSGPSQGSWGGSRPAPAVEPLRPSAPPAPAGSRFQPPQTVSSPTGPAHPSVPTYRPEPRPAPASPSYSRPAPPSQPSYSRPTPPQPQQPSYSRPAPPQPQQPSYSRPAPPQPSVHSAPPPQPDRPQVAPAPAPVPQPAKPSSHSDHGKRVRD